MISTPLQIILISDQTSTLAAEYSNSLITCFEGGGSGYLSGATDTNVPIREFFTPPPEQIEQSALCTLAIVLLTEELTADYIFMDWMRQYNSTTSRKSNRIIILDIDGSGSKSGIGVHGSPLPIVIRVDQIEEAIQQTFASLVVLHEAVQLLAVGSNLIKPKLRFFLSHAKLDGQPLAKMLSGQLKSLPNFAAFYDAEDIPQGSDWRKILENGVQDSVLIVLRSHAFESRPWCRQEMQWAEAFTSPYIVVDLRHDLITPPSRISFERAPTVRVPDGNMYRIIFIALREALRSRLHIRIVEDLIKQAVVRMPNPRVLVRQPTMGSLYNICENLPTGQTVTIVYPDPPLYSGERAAAEALVSSMAPGSIVTTPQSLMVSMQRGEGS